MSNDFDLTKFTRRVIAFGAMFVCIALANSALAASLGSDPPAKKAGTAEASCTAEADAPASQRYVLSVLTNPVEGKDAEFDHWYSSVHLAEVLAIPGFVAAQRFRVVTMPGETPQWQYFALYEMETDNPEAVVKELMRRFNEQEITGTDAMSPKWYFGAFKPITPHVAKPQASCLSAEK